MRQKKHLSPAVTSPRVVTVWPRYVKDGVMRLQQFLNRDLPAGTDDNEMEFSTFLMRLRASSVVLAVQWGVLDSSKGVLGRIRDFGGFRRSTVRIPEDCDGKKCGTWHRH